VGHAGVAQGDAWVEDGALVVGQHQVATGRVAVVAAKINDERPDRYSIVQTHVTPARLADHRHKDLAAHWDCLLQNQAA
jgi:hypothetical protein